MPRPHSVYGKTDSNGICVAEGKTNGNKIRFLVGKEGYYGSQKELSYVPMNEEHDVKDGKWDLMKAEMAKMTEICHFHNAGCKVIFENCYLTKEEIRRLAEIAKEVKPDFIKTSTGFGTCGATPEDVRLMKETVGDAVKVKAAGGIRDWASCKAMIEAGAERIGASAGKQILDEFRPE